MHLLIGATVAGASVVGAMVARASVAGAMVARASVVGAIIVGASKKKVNPAKIFLHYLDKSELTHSTLHSCHNF